MHTQLTQAELNHKLSQHKLWWDSRGAKGETLSLPSENLSGLDFEKAELRGANLVACNLSLANLRGVQLESINIAESNLCGADLSGANLKRCDFRYVEIDAFSNFEGADTTGMMVDAFTLICLPETIAKNSLQVLVDESRYDVSFYFEEDYKELGIETIQLLLETIKRKNKEKELSTQITEKGNRVSCVIKTPNVADKAQVQADFEQLGNALLGDKQTLAQVLPDVIQQLRFKGQLERLMLGYKQDQELRMLEQQKMAELHNELVLQKRENQNLNQQFQYLMQQVGTQISQKVLISSPILEVETANGMVQIATEKVIYCEKSKEDMLIFCQNTEKPIKVINFNTFSQLVHKPSTT